MSPERRCLLIRGVSKERFHCIMESFQKLVPLHLTVFRESSKYIIIGIF